MAKNECYKHVFGGVLAVGGALEADMTAGDGQNRPHTNMESAQTKYTRSSFAEVRTPWPLEP